MQIDYKEKAMEHEEDIKDKEWYQSHIDESRKKAI